MNTIELHGYYESSNGCVYHLDGTYNLIGLIGLDTPLITIEIWYTDDDTNTRMFYEDTFIEIPGE